jgi:Uma2 family endonuclease
MNVAVTRAAEGFPRRAFSVDDVRRMIDAGVIREDENIELIEGELVTMAAKSYAHERIKNALNRALNRAAPDDIWVCIENSFQLAEDVLVEPDIALVSKAGLIPDRTGFTRPRPADVQVVIEVAVSSLNYDRSLKARLYSRHGIRELWVIDATTSITWVHTGPGGGGWASILERGPQEALTTPALPGFSMKLGDIE